MAQRAGLSRGFIASAHPPSRTRSNNAKNSGIPGISTESARISTKYSQSMLYDTVLFVNPTRGGSSPPERGLDETLGRPWNHVL